MIYQDRSEYKGDWDNDRMHGNGIMTTPNEFYIGELCLLE